MAELKATRFSVTESGVATIMLSRPEALNALNGDLNNELMQHFRFCDQSNDVKVVILTTAMLANIGYGLAATV